MRKTKNSNGTIHYIILFSFVFVIGISISSCDYLAMPDEPVYLPLAEVVSPATNNITLDVDHISFQISTSYDNSAISYKLIGRDEEWKTTNLHELVFDFLNEGDYELRLREITTFGTEQKGYTPFNFIVNAIEGPAFVLADKKVAHSTSIQLALLAEEVSNLKAAQVKITYDPDILKFVEAFAGDFLATGADGYFFDYTTDENSIIITVARLGAGGADGTGALAELSFSSITTTQTNIIIAQNSIMRDSDNNGIMVKSFGKTIVTNE